MKLHVALLRLYTICRNYGCFCCMFLYSFMASGRLRYWSFPGGHGHRGVLGHGD